MFFFFYFFGTKMNKENEGSINKNETIWEFFSM